MKSSSISRVFVEMQKVVALADVEARIIQKGIEDQCDFGATDYDIFNRVNRPVTLKDVTYKIKIEKGSFFRNQKINSKEKTVLNEITGIVKPGEMLAMLGPSGSGKTTLLTAFGARPIAPGNSVQGTITYNGTPFSNTMKRLTGFIPQDDVLYPHLTVRETLVYASLLRLPNTLTPEEKIKQAEALITQLGLVSCMNSVIGSSLKRGISGGQRKRVSIGQEMLINPSLMLLDEPTSGLDSTTAQRVVSLLLKLASGGRTVVVTIHQPSSRLFYMFDKVLLLSEGNPLYFGDALDAMDYFSRIGFTPSFAMNPSDFLLDLAKGVPFDEETDEEQVMIKNTPVSSYKEILGDKLKAELQGNDHDHEEESRDYHQEDKWCTNWWQQCQILFRRGLKERLHDSFCDLKVVQVIVSAFFAGLLWWQSDDSSLQDKIGFLFYYSQFWGFFPLSQAVYAFPQERLMLEKERSSGMYRLSSYFASRIIGDLPMELALPTIFFTVTYWMAGLKPSAPNFVHTLFALLYTVLVSQGLGLALGAIVMDAKSANKLGSTIVLFFVMAGGYFVQDVPSFIEWIKYISIGHHTYKLLLGSQYKASDTYPCDASDGVCSVGEFPAIKKVGLDGQVLSATAMAAMLVGYRLIAYIALMRTGVTRK